MNFEFINGGEWCGAWVFYATDLDIENFAEDGTTDEIKLLFSETLMNSKSQFSFQEIPKMTFCFDSKENVENNYRGSYYLRMR